MGGSYYIFDGALGVALTLTLVLPLRLILSSILALTITVTCTSEPHLICTSDLVLISSALPLRFLFPVRVCDVV